MEMIIPALLGFAVGVAVIYFYMKQVNESKVTGAKHQAQTIVDDAKREADALKKEALLEAKDETHKFRIEAENDIRDRRSELQKQENRLLQREENLDRKDDALNKKESGLERKEEALTERQQHIEQMERKVEELVATQKTELERIAALTREEAKGIILKEVEQELSTDISIMTKDAETRAKEESDKKAREILSLALQRFAADHVAETTVS
ncbi:MAG: Rnase Y domain-containing protein, partial [Lysinibacillus sp.]